MGTDRRLARRWGGGPAGDAAGGGDKKVNGFKNGLKNELSQSLSQLSGRLAVSISLVQDIEITLSILHRK